LLLVIAITGFSLLDAATSAGEAIQMPGEPHLSPDGKTLAFSWVGDIWAVNSAGGVARRLTHVPSREADPKISPDGKRVAFSSDRSGLMQTYVMSIEGGEPTQLTFHSEGSRVAGWFPDGRSLLTRGQRDHYWRRAERFFRIASDRRSTEQLLFDAYCSDPSISPDGTKVLFNREGERWWRKGYAGSRAAQIWEYDLKDKKFAAVVRRETESRMPVWRGKDGSTFLYVSGEGGSFNLWTRDLDSEKERQLTEFDDDSVLWPTVSADGSTIVFRHLFDFYRIDKKQPTPQKIEITIQGDQGYDDRLRRTLTTASDVSFSSDGLEVAFIAGGDLWVMDTILLEPQQVTDTVEFERDVAFSPDGNSLLYISDREGQSDIWIATRSDDKRYWWQNEQFDHKRITEDSEMETSLRWNPAGDRISFVRALGTLRVMKLDGSEIRDVVQSWNRPSYDWSPDGKWIVYSMSDVEFNRDIFVVPIDGSREPFNLSRHPDNEYNPKWSPDGRMIAFVGRRQGDEVDIYYVFLQAEQDEVSSRDRRLQSALDRLNKTRKKKATGKEDDKEKDDKEKDEQQQEEVEQKDKDKEQETKVAQQDPIDFTGIYERIKRISINNTSESSLLWSPDSKRLAFQATVDGKRGTYTISIPDDTKPKLLTTTTGSNARWLSTGNLIVWLVSGKPASHSASGASANYAFTVRQQLSHSARHVAAFDQCWRAMRDHFYDANLNHRNWDAIRRKYREAAASAKDLTMLADVVHMMLGELNGSHLGFRVSGQSNSPAWRETTAHFGVRFEADFKGPGLKIRDVLPDSPASRVKSRLQVGEIILAIDGQQVDPAMDLTTVLNVVLPRDMKLKVKGTDDSEREVTIRPYSYSSARSALYEKWIDDSQQAVLAASDGRLGYMHIRGMNMSSFYRFERELYEVAAGKEGIVIDVRENGGGSTTDHLLTILTQPVHAITVPRGGDELGYPQDRKIYATWRKPIVVLCNQNSFSNAEIFSHAVKTLKRGKLVGVTTAGGVISTGSTRIMDLGTLRMPFRGWYVLGTGEDMERNGAVPHFVLWPKPGELPGGKDRQLQRAIKALSADVKKWKRLPRPQLRNASDRE
jgi:tricorn protease